MMKPEWITTGIKDPVTMIASDGMPYAPKAHPRTAGTFHVYWENMCGKKEDRSDGSPAKMAIMPARRLEPIAPL